MSRLCYFRSCWHGKLLWTHLERSPLWLKQMQVPFFSRQCGCPIVKIPPFNAVFIRTPLSVLFLFLQTKRNLQTIEVVTKVVAYKKLFNSQCCIWYSSLQCLVRNWSLGFIMSAGDDWKWNLSSRVRLDFFCNWILDVGMTLAYVSKTADECVKLGYVFLRSFQSQFV